MNDTTYNAGVATRTAINNGVATAADTAKAGAVAVFSFFTGLVKGQTQEQAPAPKRVAKAKPAAMKIVPKAATRARAR